MAFFRFAALSPHLHIKLENSRVLYFLSVHAISNSILPLSHRPASIFSLLRPLSWRTNTSFWHLH